LILESQQLTVILIALVCSLVVLFVVGRKHMAWSWGEAALRVALFLVIAAFAGYCGR
jgi:hypothetical protein